MRRDIMVDIETLGKGEDASIFQIGAMSFNIETGEIYDEINLIGNIASYDNLSVDGDTLIWWLNTNKELLTDLLNKGTESEFSLLHKFEIWLYSQVEDINDLYLWGNGILFDNAKLQHHMNKCHMIDGYPILYKNDRDVRTILELASMKSGLTEKQIKDSVTLEGEIEHDALDDTRYQIRLVHLCHGLLMGKVEPKIDSNFKIKMSSVYGKLGDSIE